MARRSLLDSVLPWRWFGTEDNRMAYPHEEKASVTGPAISTGVLGQAVWTPRDYQHLADQAYVRNAVAYRCVKLIASACAAIPWILRDADGNEIEKHPLLDLLKKPGPMVGGASLFEAFFAYQVIEGNGYLEAVGPSDNAPPRELWAPRPDRMKVSAGPYGLPSGYEYLANGVFKRWQTDPLTGRGPILHVKEFHPLNDWYGLGRMEPAAYGIDRHNAAGAHNKALLDNGARPSGALVFQPIKDPVTGAMQSAPPEVIEAARKKLDASHVGPNKAGKPLVFGGLVDWLEMGISPRDMDFAAGKDDAGRDICLAAGVPHILVIPGQSTYNNVREAKLELYEDTVLPLHDRSTDALNAWLCPMFGEGLTLEADLDGVSALEPRREAKRKSIVELYDKGLIDDSEAREALQYGEREPEAVGKIDAAVLNALVMAVEKDASLSVALFRYLHSVGLVDEGTTLDGLLSAAAEAAARAEQDQIDAATPPADPSLEDAPDAED